MRLSDDNLDVFLEVKNLVLNNGAGSYESQLSFALPGCRKVALVGLNGAGKSTLIRLLIGELAAGQGVIRFNNDQPTDLAFKDQLGYQASAMSFMDNLSSAEYLELCCLLKKSLTVNSAEKIRHVIDRWQLTEILNKPMKQLSQGNLQKLFIAQAFLGNPKVIILDEPTLALDPIEQQRFVDNIKALEKFNLCLFSSHHISETVAAADLVMMLHHGELIALIDLKADDEFWLISNLSAQQLEALAPKASISLSYHKRKKLFRISGLNRVEFEQFSSHASVSDKQSVVLGGGSESLMPLFSLLANEAL